MKVEIQNNEVLDFVEYVDSFYNPVTGIYPIKGATLPVIIKAVKKYVESANAYEGGWVGGDTVDRERVRDLILQRLDKNRKNPECVVIE